MGPCGREGRRRRSQQHPKDSGTLELHTAYDPRNAYITVDSRSFAISSKGVMSKTEVFQKYVMLSYTVNDKISSACIIVTLST